MDPSLSLGYSLVSVTSEAATKDFDSIVLVSKSVDEAIKFDALNKVVKYDTALKSYAEVDSSFGTEGGLIPLLNSHLKRFVYAPTGPTNRDYDDVRRFADAASKGVKRAMSAGSKSILLALAFDPKTEVMSTVELVVLLGAMETFYVPFPQRVPEKAAKATRLGFWSSAQSPGLCKLALGLECGRFAARDLGGGDPEVMAPPAFAHYVEQLFHKSNVSVEVIDKREIFEKEYPLFAAVDRAASIIPRHAGRIIFLKYEGAGPIDMTIMPVGKGITFDTGGADIKAGGIMAGMSRDKCGAAAVVGFFQTLNMLKPPNIKAIGAVAVARNSVGENCYVADEIITSRAGVTVRVGNTDAEGRMVMTDVLCKLKEIALGEKNPHLMTIATLTGHACLAVGPYTAVMDNGPAKKAGFAQNLQIAGERIGDMFEISTLRREDFEFIKSKGYGEDLLQCNNAASSRTPRGHQFPAAFMIAGSGLDKHGIDSSQPLKYSHLDIAGSSGDVPNTPTGVPILGLSFYSFVDHLEKN